MHYFGENSLSSWIHRILRVGWYLVIVGFVALSMLLAVAFFPSIGGHATEEMSRMICASGQHDLEWQKFLATPTICKVFVFPYLALLAFLLLKIVKLSEALFDNFRRNTIFSRDNAASLSTLSKWMIAFAIASFNFSSLLACVFLLLLCEIFKNGTALQEEHDLTV